MADALFIDPRGIYPQLLGPEHCWDEKRDARTYAGPGPVVAHPPCNLWVNMAAVNWKRYGRQRPAWYPGGDDGGCFASALASVRKYGGVLEHPAGSHAWDAFEGPYYTKPNLKHVGWEIGDEWGEWVCEVWQHAYGHGARKRTWLLYCGKRPPFELNWERNPDTVTHHCGHDAKWRTDKKRLEKRHASATPRAFAEELIKLAEWSRGLHEKYVGKLPHQERGWSPD
jgi:hypothetical protein